MPGTLNVGGHNIITHSGTSGAGTINLVDQAGNTILTDSGSGMSLSSNVTFPAGNCIAIHTTTSSNSQNTSSGDNTLTFGTVTTQRNNSKILCAVSTRVYKQTGSIDVVIFQGAGLLSGSTTYEYMKISGDVNAYSTGFFTGTMDSTTTLTVQARVLHDFYSGGSGVIQVGENASSNTFITVWEFMP